MASNYGINIVDSTGNGDFTVAVLRNPTAASGGTAVTIPHVENNATPTATTKVLGIAIEVAKRAALNDKAAGN